jgi:hypothetical protein
MTHRTDEIRTLIESLNSDELRSLADYIHSKVPEHPLEVKWGIDYHIILDAINRSQDITQRGVRGVIAEAVFESDVLPTLKGWKAVRFVGDLAYDFKIEAEAGASEITIQVKLQRTEKGQPLQKKRYYPPDTYVVEVQKTRSGTKRKKKGAVIDDLELEDTVEKTRPYQFGDFDILAVNMQPSSRDWARFMYTVGSWLIPRSGNTKLIEIMQPVSAIRSDVWTDDLQECIGWRLSGEKKTTFDLSAAKAEYLQQAELEREATKAAKKSESERKRQAKLAEKAQQKEENLRTRAESTIQP